MITNFIKFYKNNLFDNWTNNLFTKYYMTPSTYFSLWGDNVVGWKEEHDKWTILIPSNDADITVDDEVVNIEFDVVLQGWDNVKYNASYTFSFPENSVHETLRAKRMAKTILITVDKAVVDDKSNKRKIEIE